MSYIQAWGVSRSQSPFNTFQSPLSYGGIGKYVPKSDKKETEEPIEAKKSVEKPADPPVAPPVDVSEDSDTDIITQNNEKAAVETRSGLDKFQDLLTLGGFAPGPLGAGIDLLNTAISGGRSISSLIQGDKEGAKKHGMNALLYGMSSVPGAGDAFAAANLAKKGTKVFKEGSLAYKGAKTIGMYEGAVSGGNIVSDIVNSDTKSKSRVIPSGDPRSIGRRYGI